MKNLKCIATTIIIGLLFSISTFSQWSGTTYLTTSGKVGIGCTPNNSTSKLRICDYSLADMEIRLMNGSNNPRLLFGVNSSEAYIQHMYGNSALPFNIKIGNYNAFKMKFGEFMVIRTDYSNLPRVNVGVTSTEAYIQHTYSNSALPFRFKVGNNNVMTLNNDGVGIGTDNLGGYQLNVCGKIRSEGVRIDIDGCDFVFEEDYKLRSLEEVESFITSNKHLPDVQPARVMETDGVDVSQMNSMLLQKVEELTLYIIELNKRVRSLEDENSILKSE